MKANYSRLLQMVLFQVVKLDTSLFNVTFRPVSFVHILSYMQCNLRKIF